MQMDVPGRFEDERLLVLSPSQRLLSVLLKVEQRENTAFSDGMVAFVKEECLVRVKSPDQVLWKAQGNKDVSRFPWKQPLTIL